MGIQRVRSGRARWTKKIAADKKVRGDLELMAGFEPATYWLRISCSTSWATPAYALAFRQECLTKINCAASETSVARRSQPQKIIPHFLSSVNTHFSSSCGPISIPFLNITNSIFAWISANYRPPFFSSFCISPADRKNNCLFSQWFFYQNREFSSL